MRRMPIILAAMMTFVSTAALAHFADPAAGTDGGPTLYLGKVAVTGQENIVKTLQAIKVALKAPFSNAPTDADKVVCRINKVLGEASEYLDCATNRDYIRRREATQISILASASQADQCGGECSAVIAIHNLLSVQPQHRLHVPVNGGGFQKLLDSIPLPAVTTAPAAATGAQPTTSGSGN
jgi:hypothetical protein